MELWNLVSALAKMGTWWDMLSNKSQAVAVSHQAAVWAQLEAAKKLMSYATEKRDHEPQVVQLFKGESHMYFKMLHLILGTLVLKGVAKQITLYIQVGLAGDATFDLSELGLSVVPNKLLVSGSFTQLHGLNLVHFRLVNFFLLQLFILLKQMLRL